MFLCTPSFSGKILLPPTSIELSSCFAQFFSTFRKGSALSVPFERNRLKAASFSLRHCISLTVLGSFKSKIAFTFEGLALIPLFVIRYPRNGPSSTLKDHFLGLSEGVLRSLLGGLFELLLSSYLMYVNSTVPTPLGVWNLIAMCIMDTTMPIFYMAVLPSIRLCGELDLTMTKSRTSVHTKGPSSIVISKGTSPRGQECSPEKPTRGTFKSTLSD
ncbi:hypothetical protein Tco_0802210 [Tanacetum coccineum]|uniref:Uncharacterized protein n=1 Tax=Tanacetum coccineum TaxID=301880 RepID=A0ABQ5A1S3_9ASTR